MHMCSCSCMYVCMHMCACVHVCMSIYNTTMHIICVIAESILKSMHNDSLILFTVFPLGIFPIWVHMQFCFLLALGGWGPLSLYVPSLWKWVSEMQHVVGSVSLLLHSAGLHIWLVNLIISFACCHMQKKHLHECLLCEYVFTQLSDKSFRLSFSHSSSSSLLPAPPSSCST